MKNLLLIFTISLFLFSCEKDKKDDPATPDWLLERIIQHQKTLQSDPHSELAASAWRRFEYKGDYYFEYVNLLSSAWPSLYKYDGSEVPFDQNKYLEFKAGRCCMVYIWKGTFYSEISN